MSWTHVMKKRWQHCQVSTIVMASSHREHRQEKTVLSCRVCGVNWVRDSRRQFQVLPCLRCERICELVLTQFPNNVTIGNHVACELETGSGQDKTQFTPHFETVGHNCFETFSRRQSCLVTTSVHTANTDKTRQDSRVLSVFAVWTSHKATEKASDPRIPEAEREIGVRNVDCKLSVQLQEDGGSISQNWTESRSGLWSMLRRENGELQGISQ